MTHDLDEKGLEAAQQAAADAWACGAPRDGAVTAALRAYLDAARTSAALSEMQRLGQECEAEDRIAVLVDSIGAVRCWPMLDDLLPSDWDSLERDHRRANPGHVGPFARQIVRVKLRRPDGVSEVVGLATDA